MEKLTSNELELLIKIVSNLQIQVSLETVNQSLAPMLEIRRKLDVMLMEAEANESPVSPPAD